MNKHKYISTNMLSALRALGSKPLKLKGCHTLTLSALMARGAAKLVPKPGFIQVEVTDSGIDLLNWADNAHLRDYKTDALPAVQDMKRRKFK